MLKKLVQVNMFNNKLSNNLIKLDKIKKIATERNISYYGNSLSIIDLNEIDNLQQIWRNNMFNIKPYYAIKSFPDKEIINKMDYFDCASLNEFKTVLDIKGKDYAKNIIYANTAKRPHDIMMAKQYGIELVTVDSIYEIDKVLSIYPNCGIIIRLSAIDTNAVVKFSHKFGTIDHLHSIQLIQKCINNLKGFSFHVGSGQSDSNAWFYALEKVDKLYEYIKINYPKYYDKINIIDIGGGFTNKIPLNNIYKSIEPFIKKYYDKNWIAEPGRYFSNDCSTLLTPIISKNIRNDGRLYYVIGNSVYHSFNCIIFDHKTPKIMTANDWIDLNDNSNQFELVQGNIVGETCDGIDQIYSGLVPNNLEIGTILMFPEFGAYTDASSTKFNGFEPPEKIYL